MSYGERRVASWPLAVGVLCALLVFHRGHGTSVDEGHVYQTTQSLATRGTWQLRERLNDRDYSRYSPLPSLMALPFELAGRLAAGALYGPQWPRQPGGPIVYEALLFSFNAFTTAATAWLVAACALAVGASSTAAAYAGLAYGLGSLATSYAGSFYVQPVAAFWLMATLTAMARRARSALVASLWALSIWCRTELLLLVPFLMVWDRSSACRGSLVAGTGVGLALTICTNVLRGDPWLAGAYAGEAFLSGTVTGLYGLLLSPGKGLLWFSPLSVVGFVAAVLLRSEQLKPLAALTAVYGVVIASWWTWHGGYCWGPRLLLPVLPVVCVPLAQLWDRTQSTVRILLVGLLGYSVLLQVFATGVHPFAERSGVRMGLATEAEHLFIPHLSVLAVGMERSPDWWWLRLWPHARAPVGTTVGVLLGVSVLALRCPLLALLSACRGARATWRWPVLLGAALAGTGLAAPVVACFVARVMNTESNGVGTQVVVWVPVSGTYDLYVRDAFAAVAPTRVRTPRGPLPMRPHGDGTWGVAVLSLKRGELLRLALDRPPHGVLFWRTPGEAQYKQPIPAVYVASGRAASPGKAAIVLYEYGWLLVAVGVGLVLIGPGSFAPPAVEPGSAA